MKNDAEPKPSKLLNGKLEKVQKAQKLVESTFDTIMTTIMDLTSLMCELQNDSNLTDVHIEELKKDIAEQENKLNTRSSSVDDLIKESNRLLLEWEYNPPDPPPTPSPMAFPPPVFAPKRRFVCL